MSKGGLACLVHSVSPECWYFTKIMGRGLQLGRKIKKLLFPPTAQEDKNIPAKKITKQIISYSIHITSAHSNR